MKTIVSFLFVLGLAGSLHAGPRTSASYSLATDTVDAGGGKSASATYTHDGSIGLIAGVAQSAAPVETLKHGYIAQLFDAAGLVVNAAAPSVNESATLQLAAWQILDDATFLAVPATSVAWSVVSGPITGISAGGLATARTVYQNTAASVQGVFAGDIGALNLTVLENTPDNFGAYGGDGLGDDWQVQYFGPPPNALAGPLIDPDGDGQHNAFEYTAGLVPTDPASRFQLTIAPVVGQPVQKHLIFSPVVAGRTYTVKAKPDLATGTFAPLTNPSAPADNGTERTITDLNATGAAKFYRVEITKP